MEVYMLTRSEKGDDTLYGIFSTVEKAQKLVERLHTNVVWNTEHLPAYTFYEYSDSNGVPARFWIERWTVE